MDLIIISLKIHGELNGENLVISDLQELLMLKDNVVFNKKLTFLNTNPIIMFLLNDFINNFSKLYFKFHISISL
jgi:hypothetical protein